MAFPASSPHRERTERQVGATSSVQHLGARAGVRTWVRGLGCTGWCARAGMRAWVCRPGCGPGCAGLGADLGARAGVRTWVRGLGCGPGCAGWGADLGVQARMRTWVRGPLARIDGEYRAWNRRSYRGARDAAPIRHILSEQQIGRGAAAPRPSIDEVHPWNRETIIRIGF